MGKTTNIFFILIFVLVNLFVIQNLEAQRRPPATIRNQQGFPGNPNRQQPGQSRDTLGVEHRDDLADSITISYKYLDSLNSRTLDSSINDFGRYFTVPTGYVTLGNNGNAAFPVLFTPVMKTGWDEGLHAFDVYKYNIENTKFYHTTRPFTRLDYYIGAEEETVIKVLHTQNIRPNWNAGFNYRLISAPGVFQSQNTNHNNYRLFSSYQGKRKRYSANLVILANKLKSAENGGVQNDEDLANPDFKRRMVVPVNLANNSGTGYKVFSTDLPNGNKYDNFTAFFRHSYDLGKKDSVKVNDSTTNYLFYPKLRFQHTFQYESYNYLYEDPLSTRGVAVSDSLFYRQNYEVKLDRNQYSDFQLQDHWQMISNDFSIKQYPQTKNLGQFIEAGARVENQLGTFTSYQLSNNFLQIYPPPPSSQDYLNIALHGEYRNKTRNKKWDALLKGELYAAGSYVGDFNVNARLVRFLNEKLGEIEIGFDNINRSPSYIFNSNSAFNLDSVTLSKKENITIFSFTAKNPRFTLMARNISIANYTYFKNYYEAEQFGLVNLTQVTASTKNKLARHFNLYSDFILQQTTGQNPIRVPLLYTRQRLAFEGNFFKNLNLSTGLDVKYNTPYKANNYSPLMGSFFPQDSITISNLPNVNFFFNVRIKSLSAFVTAENLNTVTFYDGFGFVNNNFSAPHYPIPGFLLRVAVRWSFVN